MRLKRSFIVSGQKVDAESLVLGLAMNCRVGSIQGQLECAQMSTLQSNPSEADGILALDIKTNAALPTRLSTAEQNIVLTRRLSLVLTACSYHIGCRSRALFSTRRTNLSAKDIYPTQRQLRYPKNDITKDVLKS